MYIDELVTPDNMGNAVIDFGDDYLWGEWDGARITVEYGDEILAYDIEGDCRFLGVI
jgi:hypothetical protein